MCAPGHREDAPKCSILLDTVSAFGVETTSLPFREANLVLVTGSMRTTVQRLGSAGTDQLDFTYSTTAEMEARDPGVKGFFEFIKGGDVAGARRVLEHIARTNPVVIADGGRGAADVIIDGAMNTAVFGAIEFRHATLTELLVRDHGADCSGTGGDC